MNGPHYVIADLHGSDAAFEGNLNSLHAIEPDGSWANPGSSLVLLGDILADRNEESLAIVRRISALREQIEGDGGELVTLAGNHEVFAMKYLAGEFFGYTTSDQKKGLRELFALVKGRNPFDDKELFALSLSENLMAILRKIPAAKQLLDFIAGLKLVHRVDRGATATMFTHTPPSLPLIEWVMQQAPERINASFEFVLRKYFDESQRSQQVYKFFNKFETAFLNTGSDWASIPKWDDPIWTGLYKQTGITRIVTGHRYRYDSVRPRGPIETIALDRLYGMFPVSTHPDRWEGDTSSGILHENGDFQYGFQAVKKI